MGYQLWTSPITGYRRRGTRLSELRSLLGSGITAHAILEPLQSCPTSASAAEMAQLLDRMHFDVAGVQVRQDSPVIGFVKREALTAGVVSEHMQPVTAAVLISDATPLSSVLTVLKKRSHVFVLIGSEVRGIVTRADLGKPPVRVYLFGLVSLLEMHLGFWVKAEYGEDLWQARLTPARVAIAKRLQVDRRTRNQEASLIECLQFCDKCDLIVARDELRVSLGLGTKTLASRLLRRAENLRNLLAHSQVEVHGSSWEELIGVVERVESVVHESDELVERQARKSVGRRQHGLWESA